MNKKKILWITFSIIIIILVVLFVLSIIKSHKNNQILKSNCVIKIYQYPVENYNINYRMIPEVLYVNDFTKDVDETLTITSMDNKYYNIVEICDGVIRVVDANCTNHICEKSKIVLGGSIFSQTEIVCMPSGLVIKVESK